MDCFINPLLEIEDYRAVLDSVRNYTSPVNITGPSDSQKAHIAYAICIHLNCRGIFVSFNEMQARRLYEDMSFFGGDEVIFFPAREVMLYDVEAKSHDAVFERIGSLDRIIRGQYKFIVTSAEAISQKLIAGELFKDSILGFSEGSGLNTAHLFEKLVAMGYERVNAVEGRGQFAARGGIIDIFSINYDNPVRIELSGDEVDSIRRFDPASQRSIAKMADVRILPARERIDSYIPDIIGSPEFLADYTGLDAIVFADEPARMKQRTDNLLLEHFETCKNLMEKGKLLPGSLEIYFLYEDIEKMLKKNKVVCLNTMSSAGETFRTDRSGYLSLISKTTGSYRGHMELLRNDLRNWKEKKSRVIILSGTRERGERFCGLLRDDGIESGYSEDYSSGISPGQIFVTHGSLNKGFEYPSIGLAVVSDREVFGRERRPKRLSAGKKKGTKINVFTDLNPMDHVVHQSHGIGQYIGIEKLVVDSIKRDYLKIRYHAGDFLYIPTNQLDAIQKYIGSEGKAPRLNKLGGSDWARTKNRVKESLKQLAGELVKLYAQRQSLKGFEFPADTVWQKQFEELFPYEETEDQLKCIEEIKRDMESNKPMDRLLCGDVGYGKTEVAIRAVFKAVMGGKQIAYLVPTTILAQQHYNTFKERMKDFPLTVDVISRFRSKTEQKRILKGLKSGGIDILIGTHRLLQKDIQFKNLGLLVIDEEQRFGVIHKEKIKNISPEVDVLTLTATPIPRTLHMSMAGIRDMSVIEDPPEERYPVQTYVMEYDADVVRDAITRELGRKGQVFYLFNRVRFIETKAFQIQEMIPDARIAIAHGQMEERQLEDIMLDFINRKYDILVCTTIIESGLDMPNVNTIIVEDADNMGLSQLYQLRGRVGRSNRLAYAYITHKKERVLSEIAEKRLQAIKEFTEFGSGFKIAMRDLEIRGAGNLLGPEQHGHIESVGYDMYCRLLDEAVRELKDGVSPDKGGEISIDLNINAYIDDGYINTENQKIEMYKKIASIQDKQDVIDIQDELMDRYGDMPEPVRSLIDIAYIKALAMEAGFSSINGKNGVITLELAEGKYPGLEVMGKLAAKYRRQLLFNAGSSPYLMFKIHGINGNQMLDNIKILLQDIKSFDVLSNIKYN